MNTEFEPHRSDVPGFPEGPFVLVAGRLQSEPDLALSAPKCLVLLPASDVTTDAAKLEHQAAVKIEPNSPRIRFTRWVHHDSLAQSTISC
jgi:hypothetical protein